MPPQETYRPSDPQADRQLHLDRAMEARRRGDEEECKRHATQAIAAAACINRQKKAETVETVLNMYSPSQDIEESYRLAREQEHTR